MNGSQNTAELVILASANGRDGWRLVLPADVPEWLKGPETMGRLMRGESAMKPCEGEAGSDWYAALPLDDAGRILSAIAKRERRAALRVAH